MKGRSASIYPGLPGALAPSLQRLPFPHPTNRRPCELSEWPYRCPQAVRLNGRAQQRHAACDAWFEVHSPSCRCTGTRDRVHTMVTTKPGRSEGALLDKVHHGSPVADAATEEPTLSLPCSTLPGAVYRAATHQTLHRNPQVELCLCAQAAVSVCSTNYLVLTRQALLHRKQL